MLHSKVHDEKGGFPVTDGMDEDADREHAEKEREVPR